MPVMEPPKEAQTKAQMCFSASAEVGASECVVVTSPLLPMTPAESADEAYCLQRQTLTQRPAMQSRMARPGTGETLQAWSLKGCSRMYVQIHRTPHNMPPLQLPLSLPCSFRSQLLHVL